MSFPAIASLFALSSFAAVACAFVLLPVLLLLPQQDLPVLYKYSLRFRMAGDPMVLVDLYSTQDFTVGQVLCVKIRRKTTKEKDLEFSNSMGFLRLCFDLWISFLYFLFSRVFISFSFILRFV